MALSAGTRFGPYEILAPLGAGGMGEVYRGRDTRLAREVAIKVLPDRFAADPDALARFEREAQAVAALNHPNILSIHDFGRENGAVYAVTELLEGQTLREALAPGRIPNRRALDYARQICEGLAAAHARGIVHRDLKPENLFVTRDGRLKILDFGLARVAPPLEPGDTRSPTAAIGTEPGVVLGTVGYMSPEQVKGLPADARSDIFSFGAVLHEMLTGRRAFQRGTAVETMTAILNEDPPESDLSGSSVSPGLDHIIRRCLEKPPDLRFQSARDLSFAISETSSISAAPGPGVRGRRGRSRAAAAGAAALLLAALAYWAGFRGAGARPRPSRLRFQQLTFGKSSEAPSISPDGKQIAFVRQEGPEQDIFVQRVGGEVAADLTKESGFDNREPAFSPDGSQIAFRSERDGGGLFVMGASGESVRKVTDDGYAPAWSPDGRRLAFVTVDTPDPYHLNVNGSLDVVELSSGRRRSVVKSVTGGLPSWSPRGFRIAYFDASRFGSVRDVFTVSADGTSPPVAVTNDPPLDAWPFWSPDGRFLFFASDRDGPLELFRTSIDERTGRSGGDLEAFPLPAAATSGFSISRDGHSVAFEANQADNRIVRFDLDPAAGKVLRGPETILSGLPPSITISVSRDGRKLALGAGASSESLYVCDADGRNLNRITSEGMRNRRPQWSPDGQTLYYYSTRGGDYQLWSIRANGGGARPVTEPSLGRTSFCTVSNSGGSIATVLDSGGRSQTAIVAAGTSRAGGVRRLPGQEGTRAMFPYSWSPDDSLLAGVTSGPGIEILALASGRSETVSPTGFNPVFLPDGRRLVFCDIASPEKGKAAVWVLRLLDRETRSGRILYSMPEDAFLLDLAITPDGRALYAVTQTGRSDIWLMSLAEESKR